MGEKEEKKEKEEKERKRNRIAIKKEEKEEVEKQKEREQDEVQQAAHEEIQLTYINGHITPDVQKSCLYTDDSASKHEKEETCGKEREDRQDHDEDVSSIAIPFI